MNLENKEKEIKKQVPDKELSTNPTQEILAKIENKFENFNSNLTNWNDDLKIILIQINWLEKQAREEREKAEDLQNKIELEG